MTDGPCFIDPKDFRYGTSDSITFRYPADELEIDLTTFAQWIELQPASTIAGIIDLLGNDLYRRHWPTYAEECKVLAKQIRSTLTHLHKHKDDHHNE